MQMISFVLLGLVFVVFSLLYLLPKIVKNSEKERVISNIILLIASYIFVIYADYRFAIILLCITLSTWFFAKKEKLSFIGIIIALLSLGFFKYTNFFVSSFEKLLGRNDYTLIHIILPVGISFYTFSAISYLVDVKREKTEARSFVDVALYLSFFPKLTSGPIQKSCDFFSQIDRNRKVGWNSFSYGIQIFVFGLFKKIVLADRLSVFVDQVYKTPLAFGSLTVLLAVVAYSFQIYFDFSGYSDMAIGVAKILGIDLPRNFNLPYLAHNVTELWKRWHITLSEWLQEYLYIPLGGNRKGTVRTYLNLILTMVIGGLWHGASWTFIIWGTLHGLALAVHKLWMKITKSQNKKHGIFSDIVSISATFIFTTFCWIFFRAESLSKAIVIIKRIFSFEAGLEQPYMWLFIAIVIYIAGCIAAVVRSKKNGMKPVKTNVSFVEGFYPLIDLTKFWNMVIFFAVCGLMLCLAYTGGSPFIYGNF